MKKIGKVALIVSTVLFATGVLTACVSSVNSETGEKSWKFAPTEAVKTAVSAVKDIPDETKATIFEGLGWILGSLGVGATAVPICTATAGYFRNRAKNKVSLPEDSKAKEVLQKIQDSTQDPV
jgi:hypothetical protein